MKTLKFLASLVMCAGLLQGMYNREPEREPEPRLNAISPESIFISRIAPSVFNQHGGYRQVAMMSASFDDIKLEGRISNADNNEMNPRILNRQNWSQIDLDPGSKYSFRVSNRSLSNVDTFRVEFQLRDSTFQDLIEMILYIVHHGNDRLTGLNEHRAIHGPWIKQPINGMAYFLDHFKAEYPKAYNIETYNIL